MTRTTGAILTGGTIVDWHGRHFDFRGSRDPGRPDCFLLVTRRAAGLLLR